MYKFNFIIKHIYPLLTNIIVFYNQIISSIINEKYSPFKTIDNIHSILNPHFQLKNPLINRQKSLNSQT